MPINSNAADGMPSILLRPILEEARANPSGSTAGSIPTPGTRAAIVDRSPDSGRAHMPQPILFWIANSLPFRQYLFSAECKSANVEEKQINCQEHGRDDE